MASKKSQKKAKKSSIELPDSVKQMIMDAKKMPIIYLDPATGVVQFGDIQYQLRHLNSKTKLSFNNKGELNS